MSALASMPSLAKIWLTWYSTALTMVYSFVDLGSLC